MGSLPTVRLIRKFRGRKRTIDGVIFNPRHTILDRLSHAGHDSKLNSVTIELSDKVLLVEPSIGADPKPLCYWKKGDHFMQKRDNPFSITSK